MTPSSSLATCWSVIQSCEHQTNSLIASHSSKNVALMLLCGLSFQHKLGLFCCDKLIECTPASIERRTGTHCPILLGLAGFEGCQVGVARGCSLSCRHCYNQTTCRQSLHHKVAFSFLCVTCISLPSAEMTISVTAFHVWLECLHWCQQILKSSHNNKIASWLKNKNKWILLQTQRWCCQISWDSLILWHFPILRDASANIHDCFFGSAHLFSLDTVGLWVRQKAATLFPEKLLARAREESEIHVGSQRVKITSLVKMSSNKYRRNQSLINFK